ncbi:23S rRNA m(5)U-1939 methyltransferase [Desulfotomaculum arcticum]|uniref:23S rRNA m(5)U-1939 methyltransferase n=1 Tax=Desulfotruncus arcticus DSM 17038 TaxID=1121424 RepID=A0A1I2SRF3_9FIRM|nr:23S rRNA (uracil(1939)-C(5))-methyltransferase RlmD [Desulfotruncus arcticus]SFG55272.1 23S rRNA m(5)U-1939 methyltransferase [Desulfotomaculum arcticum] [Desulfotruncus arcticus DSM 17038]
MLEGREIKVEIFDINHAGEGVGRDEGKVVFVPGTVPGELVAVRLTEVHKNYVCGIPLEIISISENRQTPACAVSNNCGGCRLQHITYEEQLRLKTGLVRQNLARIGGADGALVKPIIGMADPWHYRNNVRLKVQRRNGRVLLGFYEQESHRLTIVDSNEEQPCLLAHRELNEVAISARRLMEKSGAQAALPEEVTLRRGSTGEIMVVMIAENGKNKELTGLAEGLILIPGVASVIEYQRPVTKKGYGRYKRLSGAEFIIDEIDGLKFKISAGSFYQVNPVQTAVLYQIALGYCGLQGQEEVADAYCGVGTITLYAARKAGMVRGYEVVPGAVQDARANADLNGIKNASFYQGPAEKVLPRHIAAGFRPSVILLDPPRSGCRPEVLEAAANSCARRIVYVSCDPATLARDVKRLSELGYELAEAQPVDMFPHTSHVETVVRIERK